MHYLLDLRQGLGIAAGIGIRPFLPTLLVGALAAANLGVDFQGTSFSFLEKPAFLLAIVVLVAVLGLGALEASGSIADRSGTWWPGIIVGVAAAALGFVAARSLFGRVRARLDSDAAGALPLYAEAAAV